MPTDYPALKVSLTAKQAHRLFPALAYRDFLAAGTPICGIRRLTFGAAFDLARARLLPAWREGRFARFSEGSRARWARRRTVAAEAVLDAIEAAVCAEFAALRAARTAAGASAQDLAKLDRAASACAAEAAALRAGIWKGASRR